MGSTAAGQTGRETADGSAPGRRRVDAVVVGGGISGIAAVVRLRKEAGLRDVVLVEKSDRLGGTWNYNTYPGCACDIPSSLYSFEFAPNPEWTRTFASQPEILAYVQKTADEHGVTERTLFDTEVTSAAWDDASQRWRIDTDGGVGFSAPILVFGVGALNEPLIPDVPGIDTFHGTQFHSARWNHEHDLTGRRVAMVGSAATAIQALPAIQPTVAHLTYLQRTPGWVWPKPDWHPPRPERWLYRRFPAAQKLMRLAQFGFAEFLLAMYLDVRLARLLNLVGRLHLLATVHDRTLRRTLTPTHVTGCKRIMIANSYYPAVTKPNVDVVPAGIREVRPNSIIAEDGSEHEVDTIIWATGFHTYDPPFLRRVFGREGRSLAEVWGGNPKAFMGASAAGFPNAFMMWGPNSGTGCNFVMVQAQLDYTLRVVNGMHTMGASSLDVRPEVVDAWKDEMRSAMARSTWAAGRCASWYQDPAGDIHAIYGGSMSSFLRRARAADLEGFEPTFAEVLAGAVGAGS